MLGTTPIFIKKNINNKNMKKLKSYWNKLMYWLMFKNYNE